MGTRSVRSATSANSCDHQELWKSMKNSLSVTERPSVGQRRAWRIQELLKKIILPIGRWSVQWQRPSREKFKKDLMKQFQPTGKRLLGTAQFSQVDRGNSSYKGVLQSIFRCCGNIRNTQRYPTPCILVSNTFFWDGNCMPNVDSRRWTGKRKRKGTSRGEIAVIQNLAIEGFVSIKNRSCSESQL